MKKIVSKEASICDNCNTETYTNKCLGCGKDFCWECRDKIGKEFKHAVHFSGSGDGYYCSSCLGKNEITSSKIFLAYKAIDDLRQEYKNWWVNFDKRTKSAEEIVKSLTR